MMRQHTRRKPWSKKQEPHEKAHAFLKKKEEEKEEPEGDASS